MLTPLHFSQLAAAAWSGPAATVQASASTCLLTGGFFSIYYSVTYTVGGIMFSSSACCECPFQAVAAAVAAAAAAGTPVCRRHAQRTIARMAWGLAGGQACRPGFACRARRHRCASLRHA